MGTDDFGMVRGIVSDFEPTGSLGYVGDNLNS